MWVEDRLWIQTAWVSLTSCVTLVRALHSIALQVLVRRWGMHNDVLPHRAAVCGHWVLPHRAAVCGHWDMEALTGRD